MYTEYTPDARLERWVECTWSVEAASPVLDFPVRPDGCLDLLYSPATGLDLVGAMTREQRYDLAAGERRVGLRFRPGMARRFLRMGVAELCDRVIPLEDVLGKTARELRNALDDAGSNAECRHILLQAVAASEHTVDPVHLAIDAMTRAHGEVDVDWVADQAGMSARQFRRRCREEAGLGPKQLARILRFRRACRVAERGESWLRVAVEAGYFDQAHLIRDFREFTGSTPMSVFSKTGEGRIG
jgi:AraC-like DNA-binding protein